MRMTALLIALVATACLCFSWWGLHTEAGRAQFDEMAGMIPFFAGVAGGTMYVLAIVIMVFQRLVAGRKATRRMK